MFRAGTAMLDAGYPWDLTRRGGAMSKLTPKQRAELEAKDFGLPEG